MGQFQPAVVTEVVVSGFKPQNSITALSANTYVLNPKTSDKSILYS